LDETRLERSLRLSEFEDSTFRLVKKRQSMVT
jgi:hypothetical protein